MAKTKKSAATEENTQQPSGGVSRFSEYDIHLFKQGEHFKLYEKLGAHLMTVDGVAGTYFAVWAPNAEKVSVIGDFNYWNKEANPINARWDGSGIWEGFLPGVGQGTVYKYYLLSREGHQEFEKADPFAFYCEEPPRTASVVWDLDHEWSDTNWLRERSAQVGKTAPMSVYEVHFGSWRRKMEEDSRSLTYLEMAEELVDYVKEMGFTHVEFLPIMEHPFYGSWGYQLTGYYAPTSRYGTPQEFMQLMEAFHAAGIGILLDWVPSHFPADGHGLAYFDGTHLYEHADPRKGFHPDWKSNIFNYGRAEVRAILISNALFWLDKYHIDGLRVDAVASMLYLDYSREEGEWIPNEHGGNENLEAIYFLKRMNEAVYAEFPDTITIAEESTSWPGVSRPTYMGGLGFGQKWMMGWMHDSLEFFKKEPIHRKHHQNAITFSIMYAFTENFMLPLSHDEVVHGKGSLLSRMPGDEWQRFANLRLLFGFMYAHPGTQLLFMGAEFAQSGEWKHDYSLDWHLLEHAPHQGIQNWVKDLNAFYKASPALYEQAFVQDGFSWVDYSDSENNVIIFERRGYKPEDLLIVVCNFTPVVREHYRIGVPVRGIWKEVCNSDDLRYGGSGVGNAGELETIPVGFQQREYSISLTLPPLSICMLALDRRNDKFELG